MEVLITGGAGFLGSKLARQLLARGTLAGPSGQPEKISRITLLDQVAAQGFDDARISRKADAIIRKYDIDVHRKYA
jgi:nucleoside-diphosphate-sugar epimerase